ncbi:unnamed protein product [Protopolystoma xenopodis]|uniref:RRM domain-containing protein n=1 Tax=Protopolystoma xenopodis TaxID=117903 RepID=A0A448XH50_9PLAT|nr:unnamed protein product [Protopolystoma xenopodis]
MNCGKLASIRLVLNYCGRSKGYAYVEFAHPASVNEALKLDRSFISDLDKKHDADVCENTLDQRPMFVSICDTTGKMRGPTAFSFSGGLEPNKLFVKNLDKKVTKNALMTIFGQAISLLNCIFFHSPFYYGQLVDVRISTFRDGSPKGHAYIEFLTPDEASRALVATDGLLVGDSMLSVAISNPPPRIPQKNRTDFSSTTKSNQIESKKREYMHSRTKLSLGNEKLGPKGQPDRVEFRPSEDLASSALERASFDSKSSKTNQDFRKFFLDLK